MANHELGIHRHFEAMQFAVPPSLMDAAEKYIQGMFVTSNVILKALKPFSESLSMSLRMSSDLIHLKDQVKQLERLLQKHPNRQDVKLKILNLRREIKRQQGDISKGKKHVQKRR